MIELDFGLILLIYFPVNAGPKMRLVSSSGTKKNRTSFRNGSICSSIVIASVILRGELPADRKRTTFACLVDREKAASAKLCLIRVRPALVSRTVIVDFRFPFAPRNIITLYFRVGSSWCDFTIFCSSRLLRVVFVYANAVLSVFSSSFFCLPGSRGSTLSCSPG